LEGSALVKLRKLKSVVILLLSILLMATPVTTVFAESDASFSQSFSQEWNEALLQYLIDEYGARQGLELYQWLQDSRLIDENGRLKEHPIRLDGKDYTLDELKVLLNNDHIDLKQMAEVDGQSIPLEALKKLIELEDQLAQFTENYRLNQAKITPEHLDSMISLFKQAGTEGLGIFAEDPNESAQEDYDDEVIVALAGYQFGYVQNYNAKDPVVFTFELNRPQNDRVISFEYEIIPGTLGSAYQTGKVEFPEGTTTATLELAPIGDFPDEYADPQSWLLAGKEYTDSAVRDTVWFEFSRADYVHFFNFRNFDRMEIAVKELEFYENWAAYENRRLHLFSHTYEGGAYIAYAPKRGIGSGHSGISPHGTDIPEIIRYSSYYSDTSLHPNILEVRGREVLTPPGRSCRSR
jgi:hypothetical protein